MGKKRKREQKEENSVVQMLKMPLRNKKAKFQEKEEK